MAVGQIYSGKVETARRYGKKVRTLNDWLADPKLGFPRPIEIRGRLLFSIAELDRWDAARVKPLSRDEEVA